MSKLVRFVLWALIDVLVVVSLTLACGHNFEKENSMSKIAAVGTLVIDQRVHADSSTLFDGGKFDVAMSVDLGGNAVGATRAARRLGADCFPVFFVGKDPFRNVAEAMVRGEFGNDAMLIESLGETRRSILIGNAVATVRPGLVKQTLPAAVLSEIQKADLTIVAPLTAADAEMAAHLLKNSRQSILQLSEAQLANAEVAAQLSRQASWTIVNRCELTKWTGCNSDEGGLTVLQGLGVESLIVTDSKGVVAIHDGEVECQPSFPIAITASTVGAGDCFTGTFAAMIAGGAPWKEAIRLGQVAAAIFLSGTVNGRMSPAQLRQAVTTLPKPVDLPPLPFRQRAWQRRLNSAATKVIGAAGLMAAVMLLGGVYLT